jgi:hypothetical protein
MPVDVEGGNISTWVSSNGADKMFGLRKTFHIPCHFSSYRTRCYDSDACVDSVDRRESYRETSDTAVTTARDGRHLVLDGPYNFVHSVGVPERVWNCQLQWFIVIFKGCSSGSHAVTSNFIIQNPPSQTAMATWTASLAYWMAKCSVFLIIPLQHVRQ